jgi:alanyl-tRNA synthetase
MSAEFLQAAAQAGKYRVVAQLVSGVDAGRLKDLAQSSSAEKTLALLLSETDGRLFYVLSSGAGFPIDVSELMPAVNAALGGKGGGRGSLAQGTAPSAVGAKEALAQVRSYFVKRLGDTK